MSKLAETVPGSYTHSAITYSGMQIGPSAFNALEALREIRYLMHVFVYDPLRVLRGE